MWYAVRTDIYREKTASEQLASLEGVHQVYLPVCKITSKGFDGKERSRFRPTISGILFVFVDDDKIERLVTDRGYFAPPAGIFWERTSAHLLGTNKQDASKTEIIAQSRVPTADIDRLRVYNDQLAECIDDLRIVDVNYASLEEQNDTVRVLDGPYEGFEGIIKQVKSHGNKDRRLLLSIGNFCVSIPAARTHRHIVVREANKGEKALAVNTWRLIDLICGRIQAELEPDEASDVLRLILLNLNRKTHIDDYKASLPTDSKLRKFLDTLNPDEEGCLISLSRYFQSYDRSIEVGLAEMIPDATLRPFLTPTAGKPFLPGEEFTTLKHREFVEIILSVDLKPYFRYAADEDYRYYAHVGAFSRPDGGTDVAVNWSGFYRRYALLTTDERIRLHSDMSRFGYEKMNSLLSESTQIKFTSVSDKVGGFVMPVGPDEDLFSAARRLTEAVAPAAVEMWQGTRLLIWRRLVQRYVLLHKAPVQ